MLLNGFYASPRIHLFFLVLSGSASSFSIVSLGLMSKGGVEGTRLEAKAKDTKKNRGPGHTYRRQTFSRPRTGMLEAKDQGDNADVFSKNKKDLRSKNSPIFRNMLAISKKKKNGLCSKICRFYGALQDEKTLHMTYLTHFQQIKR